MNTVKGCLDGYSARRNSNHSLRYIYNTIIPRNDVRRHTYTMMALRTKPPKPRNVTIRGSLPLLRTNINQWVVSMTCLFSLNSSLHVMTLRRFNFLTSIAGKKNISVHYLGPIQADGFLQHHRLCPRRWNHENRVLETALKSVDCTADLPVLHSTAH